MDFANKGFAGAVEIRHRKVNEIRSFLQFSQFRFIFKEIYCEMEFNLINRYIKSNFSYVNPLKDTEYIKGFSKENYLLPNYNPYSTEEPEQKTQYDCASEFIPFLIFSNCKTHNADALQIQEAYERAASDGLYEAANNLGILFFYQDEYERAERYFLLAAQQGSYYAQQNLATFYYTQKEYEKFLKATKQACTLNNPVALWNLAVYQHFEMKAKGSTEEAISTYLRILKLRSEDLKKNWTGDEEEKDLFIVQDWAAYNLAILSEQGILNKEIAESIPAIRWKMQFMKLVNKVYTPDYMDLENAQVQFSVLMSECMSSGDYSYLEEMLDENAVLIIHGEGEVNGREAVLKYFSDRSLREQRMKIKNLYSVKHHCRHNLYSLQTDPIDFATSTMLGYFNQNRIYRIVILYETWRKEELLFHTCLDKEEDTRFSHFEHLSEIYPPVKSTLPCPYCGKLSSGLVWKDLDNQCLIGKLDAPERPAPEKMRIIPELRNYVSICPDCKKEVERIICIGMDDRKRFI